MSPGEPPRIGDLGENRLVARFRELASAEAGRGVLIGPGDDTAVVRIESNRLLLLTCDMMVEEVHFWRQWARPEQIGAKAMTQNLSDVAAMGGEPGFAVASIAAPGELPAQMVEGIAQGLISTASRYGAAVVGGDLVGSPGPMVIDVALVGWVEEDLLLLRRGARAGDVIAVTGSLGASAAGLVALRQGFGDQRWPELAQVLQAHHEPRPRLAEGRAIAATRQATAMMDLSDGLADDLPRLCAESGVGARIYADRLPVDPACAAVAARVGADPFTLATSGGEDYELLFTCARGAVGEIAAAVSRSTGTAVTAIGEVVSAEEGIALVSTGGERRALGTGFDHFGAQRS